MCSLVDVKVGLLVEALGTTGDLALVSLFAASLVVLVVPAVIVCRLRVFDFQRTMQAVVYNGMLVW